MCDWGSGTEDVGEGWGMPEKHESYRTVIGTYRREDVGFPSITSINLELEDCQSKKIPVSKTNLSERQGQEAGGCLCVLFPSQTYQ